MWVASQRANPAFSSDPWWMIGANAAGSGVTTSADSIVNKSRLELHRLGVMLLLCHRSQLLGSGD